MTHYKYVDGVIRYYPNGVPSETAKDKEEKKPKKK